LNPATKPSPRAGAAAKKHVILFLAANPPGTRRRSLDDEARSIHFELKHSGHRDRFEFVTRWAAEPLDLLRALRELSPTVVHFSGHGDHGVAAAGALGGLYFHSATGGSKVVLPERSRKRSRP
jgi:hypothetical protein